MGRKRSVRVALVGRRLPDNENLGLGYLMAALRRAGIACERFVVNDMADVEVVAGKIAAGAFDMVGLSLSDGGSAFYVLTLGVVLRRRGFEGHITCGGQFATLARDWLLERYDWLDSVVRFAGEVSLVELARALSEPGGSAAGVAGVTTRAGDGPPAPVLDETWRELWPLHEELPTVLDRPMAHISASRGCRGRCAFCGPASILHGERQEGLRGGAEAATLRAAGVGTVKWRCLDDLCDEMASLYHHRGVRYFYFVDEHPLPWREEEALEYLARWRAGLEERRLGPLGIGCMLRADRVTPSVARAFADVGLVRCFVGLELASAEEQRRFGRAAMIRRAPDLITELGDLGVTTLTNLMLVHPYSTPASIARGIASLASLKGALFETTQMQVYHGTKLQGMIESEGRLVGNPLRYGYELADPVVARFAEVFTRLRGEAFRSYSLAYAAHDVSLGLALAARLEPEQRRQGRQRRRLRGLLCDVNDVYLDALRSALGLAQAGGGWSDCDGLLAATRREARAVQGRLERVVEEAGDEGRCRKVFAPIRSAAAAAVQVVALSAATSVAGCYQHRTSGDDDADVAVDADQDTTPVDADEALLPCTPEEVAAIQAQIHAVAADVDPCFTGTVYYYEREWFVTVTVWGEWPAEAAICRTDEARAVIDEQAEAVRAALEARITLDCEPETSIWTYVEGESAAEFVEAFGEAMACEEYMEDWEPLGGVRIVVGPDGEILEVDANPDGWHTPSDELLDCLSTVLEGLVFPCLANYQFCPEYAIAE